MMATTVLQTCFRMLRFPAQALYRMKHFTGHQRLTSPRPPRGQPGKCILSGRQQRVFALDELPDLLERLVERAGRDMRVDESNRIAAVRLGLTQFLDEAEIGRAIARDVALEIHRLHAMIEPFGRRIGGLGADRVAFAEQRRFAVDQKGRAGT